MNFFEIRKIGNIVNLDVAAIILNQCFSIEAVAGEINARRAERFAATLAAVYCYQCITTEFNKTEVLEEITDLDKCIQYMDPHWDALEEAGLNLPRAYHDTASKLYAFIKYLRNHPEQQD